MSESNEFYVVWNQQKTEGFATTDKQLAYEARKGSDTNCYDADGNRSDLAIKFVDLTGDEDCTIQTVVTNPLATSGGDPSSVKYVHEEDTGEFYACVPIRFENPNFVYYGPDHAYLQFDPLAIPGENTGEMIKNVALLRFGHLFEAVETIGGDSGYEQISIRPLPGKDLLETIRSTGWPASNEN